MCAHVCAHVCARVCAHVRMCSHVCIFFKCESCYAMHLMKYGMLCMPVMWWIVVCVGVCVCVCESVFVCVCAGMLHLGHVKYIFNK